MFIAECSVQSLSSVQFDSLSSVKLSELQMHWVQIVEIEQIVQIVQIVHRKASHCPKLVN